MSTVDRQHSIFIQEMIDHGDQVKAYMVAYPKCKKVETARVNSYRLLQNATVKRLIEEGQKAKQKIIAEAKKKQLQEIAKESILSAAEVDAKLSEIITGNIEFEKKQVVFNRGAMRFETVTVKEKPDATQIVAAIDKYYKRHGHYAPIKSETVRRKVLVPGEDDDE